MHNWKKEDAKGIGRPAGNSDLEMRTESVSTGTRLKIWRERVLNFWNCNVETVNAKWNANQHNREQTGIWQPFIIITITTLVLIEHKQHERQLKTSKFPFCNGYKLKESTSKRH